MRWALLVVGVVLAMCLLCVGGAALSLLGGLGNGSGSAAYARGCGNTRTVKPDGQLPQVAGLTPDQVRNAAIIIQVGQQMRVPPRGWVIAVATALQESVLTNLPNRGPGNDHDSIGLFQQRPSQGWGTPTQLADPVYQARKFFEKMTKVSGWLSLPLTVVAQRVQVSAYPDAYAKHEPQAAQIVDLLTGGAARAESTSVDLHCTSPGEISAAGWTVPVAARISSGFRTADRPGHDGVDLAAPRGTVIRAAAAGVVLVARCQAIGPDGKPWGCDRDGGIQVKGCGWYVDILHAGNVITRYCHMLHKPEVEPGQQVVAGQPIGLVGASGNSSGPHCHFEVHLNGDQSADGAVDPVAYMDQVGAPLEGAAP